MRQAAGGLAHRYVLEAKTALPLSGLFVRHIYVLRRVLLDSREVIAVIIVPERVGTPASGFRAAITFRILSSPRHLGDWMAQEKAMDRDRAG